MGETMNSIERLVDQEHPLLLRKYALFTPPIDEFFNTVCEWIENRVTGAYVHGAPRLGKSRAVQFWIGRLLEENYHGKLPFFRMNYKNHDRVSEQEFLSELLTATRHQFQKAKSRLDKLQRLVHFLCLRAKNAGGNHVVFMIDEAQNMGDREYRWLCNIQNEMDDLGYQLTVISVGSHELGYQHEVFSLGQDAHLMGRFMVRHGRFHGIRSSDDLAFVLDGYDNQTEWPEGSEISYTRYFFPKAYDAGFRISDYSNELWNIYLELAPNSIQKRLEVPMEHIAKAIEFLFRKYAHPSNHLVEFDQEALQMAIEQTSYRVHMRAIATISTKHGG